MKTRFATAISLLPKVVATFLLLAGDAFAAEPTNFRTPKDDDELRYWLQNMVWYHNFSTKEIEDATGLKSSVLKQKLERFKINAASTPPRDSGLLTLPFPGGRHPRIGFLDGAVRPQRETKISVFTPWASHDYVVVDVPEAIWSNLGLTYLAHTHVPTVWTKQGVELQKLEWERKERGDFEIERTLPNGIRFGTKIDTHKTYVKMQMWLKNGTNKTLSDLRVQNCVMLKSAKGFNQLTNDNKISDGPFAACHSPNKKRWIVTAWKRLHRAWFNERCPCLHSDPKFPDCEPGKTVHIDGILSFYEGTEIKAEIERLRKLW